MTQQCLLVTMAAAITKFTALPVTYHQYQIPVGESGFRRTSTDSDLYNPCHVEESRAASDRICAYRARRSGVAAMYDQAGGAREMAREAYLFARFEPLLE
jgi:hypothetical protein